MRRGVSRAGELAGGLQYAESRCRIVDTNHRHVRSPTKRLFCLAVGRDDDDVARQVSERLEAIAHRRIDDHDGGVSVLSIPEELVN